MRVLTNPKIEYDLKNHEGPSYSFIQKPGLIGRVEKQKPDTFFIQGQDRWLTTTGSEKAQTIRPVQEMGIIRRTNDDVNYSGPAGSKEEGAGYAPTHYEASKRTPTMMKDIPHSSAGGRGPEIDHDKKNKYHNKNNHRSSVAQLDTMRSGFSGAIGAVIAPLMDVLKPSRKEEVTNNIRVYGNSGTTVASNYVLNPNDVTNTTVKETTMYAPNFYINNQKEGQYINTYMPYDLTQRDTSSEEYIGGVGNNNSGPMIYDAIYKQTNNEIKSQTIHSRTNVGGTQMFNQKMNVSLSKQDESRTDGRLFTPASVLAMPPSKENYGNLIGPQKYNMQIQTERNTSDILNAFRQNPYTQSLTSSA